MVKILETKELVKQYHKRRVVDKVSLRVEQGKVIGLLGPNGAGKSTTFRMVAGLVKPDSGQVYLNDKEITQLPMYKRARMGIGYLPQEPTVFARLTVRENILIILEHLKKGRKERKKRVEELLKEMQLDSLANSKAGNLSGGERRRLEVTRVLATSPSFMMWDEPFAAVDPVVVEYLQTLIHQLRERGIGILITDHKPFETLSITDYAYIIQEGEILVKGEPTEVANNKEAREAYFRKTLDALTTDEKESDKVQMRDTLDRANLLIGEGYHEKAIAILTDILAVSRDHQEARFKRGQCFFYTCDYSSAVADFKFVEDQKGEVKEWLEKTRQQLADS